MPIDAETKRIMLTNTYGAHQSVHDAIKLMARNERNIINKWSILNLNYANNAGTHNGLPLVKVLNLNTPWMVSCPNGDVFFEVTHADAIWRMNHVRQAA